MPSLGLQASLGASPGIVGGGFVSREIRYLGRENGNAASNFTVQNWANTSVAKTINVTPNRYGTAGYYQIRPGSTTFSEAVGGGNNLGITAGSQPTLYSHPSFATVSGYAGTFVNFGGYPNFVQNDGVTSVRQGGLSVSINQGPFNSPTGANASYVAPAFDVTMTQTATFLLGVAVDTAADRQYAPKYVSVFNPALGTVFSAAIPTGAGGTSIPRLPVFLVAAKAGDVFTFGMWQDAGAQNVAPFSLITFDRVV